MKLSHLRYFLEVARQENMTKAAEILRISQPSLTVAIKDMEAELGVALFQRSRQRIHLTDEGNYFYGALQPVLNDLDRITEHVKRMGSEHRLVRMGIPPMMGTFLFPELFQQLRAEHPDIHLQISECGALQIQKLLREEALDIGMSIGESLAAEDIAFQPYMSCHICLCVNAGGALAEQEELSLRDVLSEPLVQFNTDFYTTRMITKQYREMDAQPNIILETSQISTIKQFVSNHLASSFLIENCILPEDTDITMVRIREFPPVTVGAAWKKGRHLPSDAVNMISYIGKMNQRHRE